MVSPVVGEELRQWHPVYTDGSGTAGRVSTAEVVWDEIASVRLPNESSYSQLRLEQCCFLYSFFQNRLIAILLYAPFRYLSFGQ